MPNWTESQKHAISARGSNIVVSAAAGSGKTAVLVERVIGLITDKYNPVDVDKMLVVTFTNAAAAEMKSRVSKRLNDMLLENPNDTNIQRQISLLPSAKICTIDSFCINLVRENFFNLDIDQDFNIMDESERKLLEQGIAQELVEELYEQDNEQFKALVEMLSSTKSDKPLCEAIIGLNSYIMSQAFPFEWLDTACEMYNPAKSLNDSLLKDYVFNELRLALELCLELTQLSKASLDKDDELYDKYRDMVDSEQAMFTNVLNTLNSGSWDDTKSAVEAISFASTPYKRGYTSPAKPVITGNKDLYKNIVKSDILPLMCVDSSEYEQDCKTVYPIITYLIDIVKEFHNRLIEQKKELNSYTFGDVEHFALALLYTKNESNEAVKTPLAKEYEANFVEILVDEYQDTNSAQDTLFEFLSNGQNRFVVGDVKQSIYRFRLAMPSIFNNRRNDCEPYSAESNASNKRIILDKNFRSRRGVCDFTNFVFSHLMSNRVGELEYNEDEYLNYGADYQNSNAPSVELHLVEPGEEENVDECEARRIAELIQNKIDSKEQIKDGDTTRDIRYSDIAILFRAPKNRLPIYSKILAEYGIPSFANNKRNLFENSEITILLSLIRVIDNPVQDVPLLATLMSCFYGYTPDDIARARIENRANNLYSSIASYGGIFERFLTDIERYRKYASSMSVENLLLQIISETSYLSVISAMGNQEQRKLNVLKLVEIAKRFDNGENVGLTAFVRYVDQIISSGLEIESASLASAGEDSVMLMSIHQSKGLEFPVCILASTCHSYNRDDSRQQIQINNELGIGVKVHNEELLYRYDSLQRRVICDQNNYAQMSENLRVLYVAITRAKEQFISFYSNKDIAKHINNLSKKIIDGKLHPSIVRDITCDGDMLLACSLLHKDASSIRELCDIEIKTDIYADFDLSIVFDDAKNDEIELEDVIIPADLQLVSAIKERLGFSYDRLELCNFSSKRTASSLDDKEHSFEFFASSKPAFLNTAGLTPAQRGSAMHAFMQYCNYDSARNDLEAEINRLVEKSYLTVEQADSLDRTKLNRLFDSSFANRMFSSNKIHREIKLSSFVNASELENTSFDDSILVQGIADCVFEENGELVLVDYKTDRVDSEQELLDRYKNQLMFYKSAVSKTLQMPVKEVMLYSFYLDKICIYK